MAKRDDVKKQRPKWQRADDSLPHQIRFITSHKPGSGITVSCTCRRNMGGGFTPLIDRSTIDLDDAWAVWDAHFEDNGVDAGVE